MTADARVSSILSWGWAGSALEDDASGDLHVVVPFDGGALIALIDGLGHGVEAAAAAHAAVPILEAYASHPVVSIMDRCHEGLRRTRGAVVTIASIVEAESSLTWVGVGNVDAVLLRSSTNQRHPDSALVLRGGVVGQQLPPLRPATLPISTGDVLILVTDGVRGGFAGAVAVDDDPQELAESILALYSRGTDDARVVVARYRGSGP